MLGFYVPLVRDGHPLGDNDPLLEHRRHTKSEKSLRPIAPFNLNPGEAAKQCFDRATGEKIAAMQLSTYAQELAQYHIHLDTKFLSAEYCDQGVTQRRHMIAANVHHIGKEADNLEEQLEHGVDPDAVLDYGHGFEGVRLTLDQIQTELRNANLSRLRIAAGVSRQRLTDVRDGRKTPKRTTLRKIAVGIQHLLAEKVARTAELDALLAKARAERDRIGLREFARRLGYDHSTVSQVLDGVRVPSGRFLGDLALLVA